jgi:ribosomal protein L15
MPLYRRLPKRGFNSSSWSFAFSWTYASTNS